MSRIKFIERWEDLAFEGCRSFVHVKGFGPSARFEPNPHQEEIARILLESDVIIFDGDDYEPNSYTHIIHMALDLAEKEGKSPPNILAFKLSTGRGQFEQSWGSHSDPFTKRIQCLLVNEDQISAPKYHALDGATDIPGRGHQLTLDQQRYVGLGVHGVEITKRIIASTPESRTLKVIAWGGWLIALREFQVNVALWGQQMPEWHYYHVARYVPSGNGGHVKQEGLLSTIEHASLIKR
jgi:hypothetical protein